MLAALTRINCICMSPNHRSIFLFKSKLLKLSCPSDLLFPILSTLVTPTKLFAFSTLPLVFFVLLMSQTHISTPLRLITHSTLPALLCTICYLGGLTPGIYLSSTFITSLSVQLSTCLHLIHTRVLSLQCIHVYQCILQCIFTLIADQSVICKHLSQNQIHSVLNWWALCKANMLTKPWQKLPFFNVLQQ